MFVFRHATAVISTEGFGFCWTLHVVDIAAETDAVLAGTIFQSHQFLSWLLDAGGVILGVLNVIALRLGRQIDAIVIAAMDFIARAFDYGQNVLVVAMGVEIFARTCAVVADGFVRAKFVISISMVDADRSIVGVVISEVWVVLIAAPDEEGVGSNGKKRHVQKE